MQLQLLESEMRPYWLNMQAVTERQLKIMNGVELRSAGQKRAAYWFYPIHPVPDMPIELTGYDVSTVRVLRVPEVLHVYKCTRPGQMRGVPLITPALVRMFLLDQYDDAELERKRIAAMFAGFITTVYLPEDVIPLDGIDELASPQSGTSVCRRLETELDDADACRSIEDIKFSEPADVGGTYEAYRVPAGNCALLYASLGIPYSIGTSDLRRANYSSLRGSIVEYRRKLEQLQHNTIVFQMCRPIWERWFDNNQCSRRRSPSARASILQRRHPSCVRSGYRSATIGSIR